MNDKNKYNNALEKLQEALAPKDGREISGLTRGCIEEIFPELKESEDERIRKELIEHIKANQWADYVLFQKFSPDDVIAWLEKQESVEEIVERCKDSWYNEGKIAGMAEGLSDDIKYQQGWHDALEKQGEQNPAWSKEDEKNLKRTIWYVENPALNVVKDIMLSEWLKSLKGRVQPQLKQEWSEEDKNFMHDTLSNLTELKDRYGEGYGNVGKCIEWLKSLRHQKQWKPSEEQMDALEHFVRSIGESGYACPYDNDTKLIYSLLEQLKQL